jgi:hypothetical protein
MIYADCLRLPVRGMVEPVFSLQMVFHFLRFNWSLPILSTIPVFFFYFLCGRVNIAVCIHSGNK